MSSYPKWLYSAGKEPALVADEAAHGALGSGWVESPAGLKIIVVPEVPKQYLDQPPKAEAAAKIDEDLAGTVELSGVAEEPAPRPAKSKKVK